FFIIAQGQVEVLSKGIHGANLRLALLTEGEFFGESDLVSDNLSDVTVRTITPCTLLTLSRRDLDAVLAENPSQRTDFEQAIRTHLELRSTVNRYGERNIDLVPGFAENVEIPEAFVDYSSNPREYSLSAAQTVGRCFLRPGDEIVLTVLEHHANIVPWQMAARETGAVIKVVPVDDRGEIQLDAYESLLSSRTKLVSLTHASNSLGTILPVEQMTAAAKRHGALVLIDGAQTVSHMPVNVQAIGCDFFVFSGHKLFAPTGIGALFARHELQQVMPPWQGGGNMIRTVTFEETTFSEPPAKFEAGTPSIADAVGLHAAINYLLALGWPAILRHEHELLEYGTARLLEIPGLRLIGQARHKVGVLSFVLPGKTPVEIGQILDRHGIAVRAGHHCAQPSLRRFGLDATVRPSLAIYNTTSDIDRLADAVRRIATNH
ncbi:MAG: aminotransferase class V-fold PLP-dependent enzyme, partial [Planctomycetaceae bacterium]